MTHKQHVCKKSGSSLHKVIRFQQAPRTTLLVLGRCHNILRKTVDQFHTALSHGCARSLLKPCSTKFHSFQRCRLVVDSCCVRVATNTESGTACSASTRAHRPVFASASRLLVPPSSPLSYPTLRRFRHSRYFAVCNAFVKPPAVFVCVGSLITVNLLSSCFA